MAPPLGSLNAGIVQKEQETQRTVEMWNRIDKELKILKERKDIPSIINYINKDDFHTRVSAIDVLKALDALRNPSVIEALVNALDGEAPFYIISALRKAGTPSVEKMSQALLDTQLPSNVRGELAKALGNMKNSMAVPSLITAMEEDDKSIKKATARALNKITGQRFGEDLDNWKDWWGKETE